MARARLGREADEARRLARITSRLARSLAARRGDDLARGRAALIRGDGAAAARAFRGHLAKARGSYAARMGLAAALARTGRRAAATRAFAELGLHGDLEGLADLAWEVLGADDVDLGEAARAAAADGDLTRALVVARLAGAHDLVAALQLQCGHVDDALRTARRGRLAAATRAKVLLAANELAAAEPLLAELARSDRSGWSNPGGDALRTLGWSGLALVRYRAGELTQALAAVREARAVTPGDAGALLVEIASLAGLGFEDRARKVLAELERHHPLTEVAWGGVSRSDLERALLGHVAPRRAALVAANAAMDAAIADAADGDATRRALATATANYRRALGTRALASEPARAAARRWAVAHAWLGERAASVAVAERLVAADRDDQSALRVIAWAGRGARARRAYRAAGLGPQVHGALHPTERTHAAFQALSARDALTPIRRGLRDRAAELMYYGMHAAALDVYAAARLTHGEPARYLAAYAANELGSHPRAWTWLAPYLRAHRETSYYMQSIDAWKLGEQVAPPTMRGWVTRTIASIWRDRADRAHSPQLLAQRALHARGFAAERAGDVARAIALYLEALETQVAADVAGNAGNLLVDRGETTRADRWFAVARFTLAELDPPLRRGWQLAKLAWRYVNDQPARAAVLAARAAVLTRSPGDHHTLALACRAIGDVAGARAALAAGLALDPSHDDLRAVRTELNRS